MSQPEPSLEELQRLLIRLGVQPGTWGERSERVITPERVHAQRENLIKLRGLLDLAMQQDQNALAALREQLTRLEHGGGS